MSSQSEDQRKREIDKRVVYFGPHKGKTPEQIAKENPAWLVKADMIYDYDICSRSLLKLCKRRVASNDSKYSRK